MAMPSNPAPFRAQDSPRTRGYSSVQPPPSGIPFPLLTPSLSDHDQFVASSLSPPSDSFPSNDTDTTVDSQLGNAGGPMKRVSKNKPCNDSVTAAVMGADSWPALLCSARALPKALSEPSDTTSQEMPVSTFSSNKDGGRSKKHDGGGGNSNLSRDSVVETTPPGLGVRESSSRDSGQRGSSYAGNEVQQQQHDSFRKNNSGSLFRVDGGGSHNRNVGGKRDQHAHQRRGGSRPFLHGTSPHAPFIPHPHPPSQGVVRPFGTSMVYGEMPSPLFYVPGPHPDSLRPMSMVPIPSIFFPPLHDPYLHSEIVKQIDYYFSNENLVKDIFLRKNMDNEGCVLINLIAGFKKVMQLTDNIQLILYCIQASNVVEVQGYKVRRKNDWIKWIMPPIESIVKSPRSIIEPSQSMLAAHLHSVALGGKAVI